MKFSGDNFSQRWILPSVDGQVSCHLGQAAETGFVEYRAEAHGKVKDGES